jgi:deazaflavin-dependent oxidoreductase (nitroreductase family)
VALPRGLARFNRVVTNQITKPFAGHLPGFAVVEHVGRKSGTEYRTPVMAFRHGDGFVIVLTYTHHTDWFANVMAAGSARLVYVGKHVDVDHPELVQGEAAKQLFPTALRPILAALHVDEALTLSRKESSWTSP